MKPDFVFVDLDFMRQIASGSDRLPSLYYSSVGLIRRMFWRRLQVLFSLILRFAPASDVCLEFGGGGGVFLPTLSRAFRKVVCIDLETIEARQIVDRYKLPNVEMIEEDIRSAELTDAPFGVIVAADVLEHFQNLTEPVYAIKGWLNPNGILVTSLPTENGFYVLLRKVFGIEKPTDHYHSAEEVEKFLSENGFALISRRYVPLKVNLLSLFSVAAWRLKMNFDTEG